MAKNYKPKPCVSCGRQFKPASGAAKACPLCQVGQESKAPPCACGCGELVSWNRKTHSWRKFVRGHHTKGNAHRKGKPSWNKGTLKLRKFKCKQCNRTTESRDKRAKFCSIECYHQWNQGENNTLWTGGKSKTKYRSVQINGRNLRAHRAIMEERLCRRLRKEEVVHHIDENGLNNQLGNLHLFHCDLCHRYHHRTKAPLQYEYADAHRTRWMKRRSA